MTVVVVEDLLFLSKIEQTAQMVGVPIEAVPPSQAEERARDASTSGLIVDLNHRSGRALELVKALKGSPATKGIPIVGFLSHVQGDLAAAARAAGCDLVLARSAMARKLPELLKTLAQKAPAATQGA